MATRDGWNRKSRRRNKCGHAISEFGSAMVLFICFFLAPLIDVSFIPVRYLIAQGVLCELTHRLSLAETRTDAYTLLNSETWWQDFLNKFGITAHDTKLKLVVLGKIPSDMTSANSAADHLTSDWLPEGSKGPCVYSLELSSDCDLPPLFSFDAGLPGFTTPVTLNLKARSQWENLGRNPQTGNFYINE